MTGYLLSERLYHFDCHIKQKNRRVLLLMDNAAINFKASCHSYMLLIQPVKRSSRDRNKLANAQPLNDHMQQQCFTLYHLLLRLV